MQHIVIDPRGCLARATQAFLVPDDPEAIGLAIDALIARLDARDGDCDIEVNGDELDGTGGEDDFCDHARDGIGCPLSDPGGTDGF